MNTRETVLERMVMAAGSCMFFCGMLMLGPLGFLFLLGLFYAMLFQNFALGLIIGFLLCTPAIFGITWAALAWSTALRERMAHVTEAAAVAVTHTKV
jgi:hypothetical protein